MPTIIAVTLPTMVMELIPISEQVDPKHRLQDRDGKFYVAFNKATIVADLEESSDFQIICDPARLPHLLRMDDTKLDITVINSRLQRIVLLDDSQIDYALWSSAVQITNLRILPVFKIGHLAALFTFNPE